MFGVIVRILGVKSLARLTRKESADRTVLRLERMVFLVPDESITTKMADLNLKDHRTAYKDRSAGLNDEGENLTLGQNWVNSG